ncbi:MAG: MOSC N-terminal beta barrel domain-containing protein, partial [Pseudomonadales bacterium]|nr:MOSC N-terminal beta barrel domain-containing protein [Pseudomonadales bacterium]
MKTKIGEIKEIWRYPVKSMAGSTVTVGSYDKLGMIGDRGWTLKDRLLDEILSAKRVAKIMQLEAAYASEPKGKGDIPAVIIRFPDGSEISSDHPAANPYISAFLIKAVKLSRLQKQKKHYRKHSAQSNPAAVRRILGMKPDDDMGGLASIPVSLLPLKKTYVTPPFTHYDIYPLHLLTSSTLNRLQKSNPDAQIDVRRFRPSFLIDTLTDSDIFLENSWSGGYLEIGSTVIKVEFPTL